MTLSALSTVAESFFPAPQSTVSFLPFLALIESLPAPPLYLLTSLSPDSLSLPLPPSSESLPSSPASVSLPPPPKSQAGRRVEQRGWSAESATV